MISNSQEIKNYLFENIEKNLRTPLEKEDFIKHLQKNNPYFYSDYICKKAFDEIIEITKQFSKNNDIKLYIRSIEEHINILINEKSALVLAIASFFKDVKTKDTVSMFNKFYGIKETLG